ncbi:hypothetical protein T492DRAFT_1074759 [Pavlovales sp. CCMP2436]|nr:hypothetical protein T492DRAFT_1074759 [Pavlovales sp. CCMP2436]
MAPERSEELERLVSEGRRDMAERKRQQEPHSRASIALLSVERAFGFGSAQRHSLVGAWDVVREAMHDLKLARHELTVEEQARISGAESQGVLFAVVPFGLSTMAGFFGTRYVNKFLFGGKSGLVLTAGYIGLAFGRECSAGNMEEACSQLDGSVLARTMVATREELERELRSRRYEVYDDIFKGIAKR